MLKIDQMMLKYDSVMLKNEGCSYEGYDGCNKWLNVVTDNDSLETIISTSAIVE